MPGKSGFHITDTDREWVHESFDWLLKAYGYPSPDFQPVLLTDQFFPLTIVHKQTDIEPLVADLCNLFNIDPSKVFFETVVDISSFHETPYQVEGIPFESNLELINGENGYEYKIYFSQSLLKNPKRLVFNSVFQFIQINLSRSDTGWIGSEEHHFLFYLIGIYTGWGVLLAQTMSDTGKEIDGFWERSWRYISPMPIPVMAYSLAIHTDMLGERSPSWKNLLPPDIRSEFEKAIEFIVSTENPFYNKQELAAHKLFKEAHQLSNDKIFDKAIETYQKALFLTSYPPLRSLIYNNIGYTQLYLDEYEKSILSFHKAIEIDPAFGYANDNLGYAYIMCDELETGRYYLSIALETSNNEDSYSYRNMALYHQKRGENELARLNFKKAFDNITFPVDWLEYFYARFLYEQGEKKEAMIYLQLAIDKGEPQAIRWMKEINTNPD